MLIKVDMENAYDHLSWSCIRDTMEMVGLPTNWVQNIMHCIENTRMSVMWNGKNIKLVQTLKGDLTRRRHLSVPFCTLHGKA